MAAVNFHKSNDWGAGFTGEVAVLAGDVGLNGWTIEFDAPISIDSIWGAVIVSHTGNHFVLRNADYDGVVAAGGSITFGFQANPGGAATADHFTISAATPGTTGPATPALPTLAIADASILEGNAGSSDLIFTVTLSAAATAPVTVNFATSDGSAHAGSDYQATSGQLTFAPGETSHQIHVAITGDTLVEPDEAFSLQLSAASGATIADATATGILRNDDAAPATPPSAGGASATGYFHTQGNQILDSAGNAVKIAGVNWFGLESPNMTPHGLWAVNWQATMDQMKELGFNTIRLPFSTDLLHSSAAPTSIDYSKNPDLQGLTGLQIMDKVIAYAGDIGLRIILDHHSSAAGSGASANGLWYDSAHSEQQWINDWAALATRYANNPTVIGADLQNEPWAGTWGDGTATDWAAAATKAGNAAIAANPGWLIFVEGIANYQGSSYWWGGNLEGVKDHPVTLAASGHLVYSAHDYGNSIAAQPWFQGSNFAAALPAVFDKEWGYIYKQEIAPVYVGEFGSKLQDPKDLAWLAKLTAYLGGDFDANGTNDLKPGELAPSFSWWAWNPNSGDTGGILQDDWKTPIQAKLDILQPLQFDLDHLPAVSRDSILFQHANGDVAIWQMQGTAIAGGGTIAQLGTAWHALALGDFYGDHGTDVLWQHSDGTVAVWKLDGTAQVGGGAVANPGPAWQVVGTGDFDGNGKTDILFQNTVTGDVATWQQNGTAIVGGGIVAQLGHAWTPVATGDFNGDGRSDIVWQNTDGNIAIWEMNGTQLIGGGNSGNPGTAWRVVDTGDFNHDGKADILFQNTDGTVAEWQMDGNNILAAGNIATLDPAWKAVAVGNYFGNGKSDILFQNSDGLVAIWEMNGFSLVGGGNVANPSSSWHTV